MSIACVISEDFRSRIWTDALDSRWQHSQCWFNRRVTWPEHFAWTSVGFLKQQIKHILNKQGWQRETSRWLWVMANTLIENQGVRFWGLDCQGNSADAIVTMSYTLLEGVLDVMVESLSLSIQVKLATFGDNRLLDFLPFKSPFITAAVWSDCRQCFLLWR